MVSILNSLVIPLLTRPQQLLVIQWLANLGSLLSFGPQTTAPPGSFHANVVHFEHEALGLNNVEVYFANYVRRCRAGHLQACPKAFVARTMRNVMEPVWEEGKGERDSLSVLVPLVGSVVGLPVVVDVVLVLQWSYRVLASIVITTTVIGERVLTQIFEGLPIRPLPAPFGTRVDEQIASRSLYRCVWKHSIGKQFTKFLFQLTCDNVLICLFRL